MHFNKAYLIFAGSSARVFFYPSDSKFFLNEPVD